MSNSPAAGTRSRAALTAGQVLRLLQGRSIRRIAKSRIIKVIHDSTSSDFANVRSVKGSRALRVIKVNEPLAKNQVYVEPADYDFVFGFIRDHCPNAHVRG